MTPIEELTKREMEEGQKATKAAETPPAPVAPVAVARELPSFLRRAEAVIEEVAKEVESKL